MLQTRAHGPGIPTCHDADYQRNRQAGGSEPHDCLTGASERLDDSGRYAAAAPEDGRLHGIPVKRAGIGAHDPGAHATQRSAPEVIGFLNGGPTADEWKRHSASVGFYDGARRRALQLGMRLEPFWLGPQGAYAP